MAFFRFTQKKLIKIIAGFLFFIFSMFIFQYSNNIQNFTTTSLKNESDNISISKSYFIDTTNTLSINDIVNIKEKSKITTLAPPPWSFNNQTYWLDLQIINNTSNNIDLVSHFSNPLLETLVIHRIADKKVIESKRLGWSIDGLSTAEYSLPSYNFHLKGNSNTQLLIKIQDKNLIRTPINIYWKDDFNRFLQFTFLIWGSFIGILVAMSLYNLLLFSVLKDAIYIVYICYTASALILIGTSSGFGYYIFPDIIMKLFQEHVIAINIYFIITILIFSLFFFNAKKHPNFLYKVCLCYITYLCAFLVFSLVYTSDTIIPAFLCSIAFLYPLSFIFIIQQLKKEFRWARLYIISWIPLVSGSAIHYMELTGIINSSFFISHVFMIVIMLESILMAMALADRIQLKRSQILYKITHFQDTKLASLSLLESKANKFLTNNHDFAIGMIKIPEFSSLSPYLDINEKIELTLLIARSIEKEISSRDSIITIDSRNTIAKKIVSVNDGVFALIIDSSKPTLTDKDLHTGLAKFNKNILKGEKIGSLHISLTINIGVSSLTPLPTNIKYSSILKQASQALEKGERSDRTLSYYEPNEEISVKSRLALAADFQLALRNNELFLFHQPQINLKTNEVDGSEVLLRWQHPQQGYIAPDVFVKLAEDTGIINELTLWVIDTACKHLEKIISLGIYEHNISVNISGKDISKDDFLSNLECILSNYDIPLSCLTFELTESVLINDFQHLSNTLTLLKKMGVQVSIDDYGTGYSSLFYISQLPFTEIKIDKSFIANIEHSEKDLTIVKTTLEMARSLNLKVVAEGIESKAVELILREYGCQIVQGYYYKKPTPFPEYCQWLQKEYQKLNCYGAI